MKNRMIITLSFGLLTLLSCKNDVPVAPTRPPAPIEMPKKNDVPNPKPVPEKPVTPNGISAG